VIDRETEVAVRASFRPRETDKKFKRRREYKDRGQHPVLIYVGQVTQKGKLMTIASEPPLGWAGRALVRLEFLDDCSMNGINFGEPGTVVPNLAAAGPEGLRIILNRELNPAWPRRIPICKRARQLPSQMVEGGSEIVNNVSHPDAGFFLESGEIGHGLKAKDVIPALAVEIGSHGGAISTVLEGRPDVLIKAVSVFFGPSDFGPAAFQGGFVHELLSEGEESPSRSSHAGDAQGIGDTRTEAERLYPQSEEGSEALTDPPTEEVASQTPRELPRAGCSAKRTRSDSPEDA
jgi:hypothetical protein